MAEQRPNSPKTVRFNVGGRLFETPRTLIDQHESTTLARLVSDTWQEDPTKPVIINRDGDIFAHVLTYLRDGSIVLPSTLPKTEFLRDLEFYGIVPAEGSVTGSERGSPTEREVKWTARFDELVKYKEEHGHCRVPSKQGQLGSWVTKQRFGRGKLSANRIGLLEGIGFEWSLATHVDWDSRFQQLVEYKDKHGHCRVPQKQGQLGRWVMKQRLRRGELSAKRVELLEGIGFEWSLAPLDWDTRFQQLVEYKDEHGHCRVPQKQGQLGSWVKQQREKSGGLSAKRVGLLEGIGFEWSLATHVGWDTRFQQLVEYKDKHGHCRVPQKQGQLGSWVKKQRPRRGGLSAKRVALLEGIGFEWSLAPVGWDTRFQQLVEYKNRHGHCRVSQKQGPLGAWANRQRQYYRNRELSDERVRRLRGIGFEWCVRTLSDWDTCFQQLVEYKNEHGHCRVPRSQEALGTWVRSQRQLYSNRALSDERVGRLEGIGFEWSLASVGWDSRFQQLVEYKEEHGHCRVPAGQGQLGRWVKNQRHRNRELSGERVRRLEGIGFEWCVGTRSDWDTRFQQLVEYKDKHGHCRVPQSQEALGTWVMSQRQLYRNRELSDERVRRLEGIGFEWCIRTQLDWDTRFQQLVEYKDKHGHCRVPQSQEALGAWVKSQRQLYRNRELSDERVRRLEGIEFEWCIRTQLDWDTRFQQLVEYKDKHGHCRVPQRQEALGTWVMSQRQLYRNRKLSDERVRRLEEIGFEWSCDTLFQQMVE